RSLPASGYAREAPVADSSRRQRSRRSPLQRPDRPLRAPGRSPDTTNAASVDVVVSTDTALSDHVPTPRRGFSRRRGPRRRYTECHPGGGDGADESVGPTLLRSADDLPVGHVIRVSGEAENEAPGQ